MFKEISLSFFSDIHISFSTCILCEPFYDWSVAEWPIRTFLCELLDCFLQGSLLVDINETLFSAV